MPTPRSDVNIAAAPYSDDDDDHESYQDDSYESSNDDNDAPLYSVQEESPLQYDDSTSFHDHDHYNTRDGAIPVTEVPAADESDDHDVRVMAKRATRHIRFWRVVVMLTLILVGTAASCGVWYGLGYLLVQQQDAQVSFIYTECI